jgi:hypothetical protein
VTSADRTRAAITERYNAFNGLTANGETGIDDGFSASFCRKVACSAIPLVVFNGLRMMRSNPHRHRAASKGPLTCLAVQSTSMAAPAN